MRSFDCKTCKVSADRSIFLTNLFKKLSRRGKEQTAEATLLSKRFASARFPTQGNTWDRWVKFRLTDDSQVELIATEEQFESLAQGQSGTLTWEGENLLRFDTTE